MELIRKLPKLIRRLPVLFKHHMKAMEHFDAGDYAKALPHFAKYEQIMLSMSTPLPPRVMLEKALCHQALEQDNDAVAYMNLIWERIKNSTKLNADEKAYVFTYMTMRAAPYLLSVKEIPPGYDKFRLENISKKIRRRYVIAEVEELENAPTDPHPSQRPH